MYQWRAVLLATAVVFIAGCATEISPDTYSSQSAGQISHAKKAVVVSSRMVRVQDEQTDGGKLAGGVLGGIAGSTIGSGGKAEAAGAIGGAVLGGLLGSKAQKQLSNQDAIEYVLQTEDGDTISIVQGADTAFNVGDRVLLITGQRARIVPDPQFGY